jgi:hypothetical protein
MNAALEIGSGHHFVVPRRERLIAESHSDFLQRVTSSLDVVPVSKSGREQAETGDNEVEVATDAGESIGRDHADDEIENPVGSLCHSQWVWTSLEYRIRPTVASAMPLLRLRSGKISAGKSHGIGPQVMP